MPLKTYEDNQEEQTAEQLKKEVEETIPSGIACSEEKCEGEMMIKSPIQKHPQLRALRRAQCNGEKCGWLGWV